MPTSARALSARRIPPLTIRVSSDKYVLEKSDMDLHRLHEDIKALFPHFQHPLPAVSESRPSVRLLLPRRTDRVDVRF